MTTATSKKTKEPSPTERLERFRLRAAELAASIEAAEARMADIDGAVVDATVVGDATKAEALAADAARRRAALDADRRALELVRTDRIPRAERTVHAESMARAHAGLRGEK